VAVCPVYYYVLIRDYLRMNIKVLDYIGVFGFLAELIETKIFGLMKRRIISAK